MGKYLRNFCFYGVAVLGGLTVADLMVGNIDYGMWLLFIFGATFITAFEEGMRLGQS